MSKEDESGNTLTYGRQVVNELRKHSVLWSLTTLAVITVLFFGDVLFLGGQRVLSKAGTDLFLKLDGAQSEGILLAGNDFRNATKVVEQAPDVPKKAVSGLSNLVD